MPLSNHRLPHATDYSLTAAAAVSRAIINSIGLVKSLIAWRKYKLSIYNNNDGKKVAPSTRTTTTTMTTTILAMKKTIMWHK